MTDTLKPVDTAARPETNDLWTALRRTTSARIGLGRRGDALPMNAVLDFQLAHAKARDAVHTPLDVDALVAALAPLDVIKVESAVPDRSIYLRRPDLGRRLGEGPFEGLHSDAPPDLVVVVADGLSATAVQTHAAPFIHACMKKVADFKVAPIVIATQARVALGDEIGERLGARLCAMVIGERPGLTVADSLGIYLTYGPRRGRRDSERNCISNVHLNGGLTYALAARKLAWLMRESLRREISGVALKDDMPAQLASSDSAALQPPQP